MNPAVAVLAVHRLVNLVVEDELTAPLRAAVERWSDGAELYSLRERVAFASTCPACVSVWAAGTVLLLGRARWGRGLVFTLAASAAALIVDTGVKRLEG